MNSGRRAALHGLFAVFVAAALSNSLAAQVVRGTVSDSVSGQPVSGAVVTLLDAAGAVLDRGITGERGEYRVTSDRAARSLRVVRIGFQPREIAFTGAVDPARPIDVAMAPFSTTLTTVRVTDKSKSTCPQRSDRAAAFAFWDQARAGLLNTIVARKANPMSLHRLYFTRAFKAGTDSVKSFVVHEDSVSSTEISFAALRTAADLVRRGFSGDATVDGFMFGPDADVLLDDAFANGYCFRLADSDKTRPNQVGVAFSPPDFRRGRVDIDGVLWIDTVARALHDVEFRYVGMQQIAEQFHTGGTISFAAGANGVAFIDRWSLRLVANAPFPVYSPNCRADCGMHNDYYPTENGAEVSHAVWRDGRRWDARLGTVAMQAMTGAAQRGTGVTVQLADSPYRGTADSSGTVRISDLLPGSYTVRIRDPRTAALDVTLPTSVRFTAIRGSVVQLSLTIPSVEDFVASECRKNRHWNAADSTFLLGRVVDHDGKPVADARVTFAVRQKSGGWIWEKDALKSGADGVFAACSTTLTSGSKLQVRVEGERMWTREVTLDIIDKTTIVPTRVDVKP